MDQLRKPCDVCYCEYTWGFCRKTNHFYCVCPKCSCGFITSDNKNINVVFGEKVDYYPNWRAIQKEYEIQNKE